MPRSTPQASTMISLPRLKRLGKVCTTPVATMAEARCFRWRQPQGDLGCSRADLRPVVGPVCRIGPTHPHSKAFAAPSTDCSARTACASARSVLGQPPVAHLHMPELALDDPERVLHLGPDAGLELFELVEHGAYRAVLVQGFAIARDNGSSGLANSVSTQNAGVAVGSAHPPRMRPAFLASRYRAG